MSVVINTNYAATQAANNLAASNTMLQKSLNRLSSGQKVVNPSDDAGGLAVALKLSAAAKRSGATNTNIANSMSYLQTQDGALKVASKVLDRISELKILSEDATKNSSDKANYDVEYDALVSELGAIAGETLNGVSLFGTAITAKVSEDGGQTVALTSKNFSTDVSGVFASATDITSLNLTTVKEALQDIATMRANNGAEQSRLTFASELLTLNKANLEAANSRIMDVDVAEESTQLARWNILVQSGTAMLAQANGSAQTALRLIS
jgi:flagellin